MRMPKLERHEQINIFNSLGYQDVEKEFKSNDSTKTAVDIALLSYSQSLTFETLCKKG